MNIQFSTINHSRAKEMLDSDAYKHLSQEQKEFILKNLGEMRVMDPAMHGAGISCTSEKLAVEFAKLGKIDDYFCWTHSCRSINPTLIALALDSGVPLPTTAVVIAIERCSDVAIALYMERKLIDKKALQEALGTFGKNAGFVRKMCNLYGIKKVSPFSLAASCTSVDLLGLIDVGIISHQSLRFYNRDKYNEIVILKKKRKQVRTF